MTDKMAQLFISMEKYAAENKVPIINKAGAEVLKKIIAAKAPASILEIGTAIGYSTMLMAFESPSAHIITIEKEEARFLLANDFIAKAGLSERICTVLGDADEILPRLEETFDAVFIDAAKGHYLANLKAVMDNLNPGAVIIADNVLFRGWVNSEDAPPRRYRTIVKRLRAYLAFVEDSSNFITTVYPIGDGIAVSYYGK